MKTALRLMLAAGAITLAAQANAITIFSDDFNSEGPVDTFNYTGFANWTVAPGTVDLIGAGGAYDLFPGNGLYVDLDGSTGVAGTMTSIGIGVTPGNYVLSFMLGGNARSAPNDTVNVSVDTGFAAQGYSLASSDPLALQTIPFVVGSATTINLVFANLGGDNTGAILDNVTLERLESSKPDGGDSVPDGGMSVVLLGMSLFAIGFGRKITN